jgi:hypothetical protein
MVKSFLSLAFLTMLVLACNSKQESTEQYYPIGYFLKQELAMIDSFDLPITKYHSDENGADSGIIKTDEFKTIVDEILLNSLSEADALDEYEESTIRDLQLAYITISYTSKNNNLNKVDVYIDPASEKVKSIYAVKTEEKDDVPVTKKIFWTSGSQLLIVSIFNKNEGVSTITERYNWSVTSPK